MMNKDTKAQVQAALRQYQNALSEARKALKSAVKSAKQDNSSTARYVMNEIETYSLPLLNSVEKDENQSGSLASIEQILDEDE